MTLLLLLSLAGLPDGFVSHGVVDGIEVSARPVAGSGFVELRFTEVVDGTLEALCRVAFGSARAEPGEPHLVSRELVSESEDERTTYERIAPPMVSKRDFVVRRWRTRPDASTCRVDFVSVQAPERAGWVRLKRLAGSFVFTRQADGQVRVEHRVHMDPGGMLAPFVVEPTREKMGLAWMRKLGRAGGG